jgi:hypothetical protein
MNNIKFQSVQSSNIQSVGYDETTSTLFVKYTSGTYKYNNVDKKVYDDLLTSTSKGRFMNENIKGQYTYSKV